MPVFITHINSYKVCLIPNMYSKAVVTLNSPANVKLYKLLLNNTNKTEEN